MCEIDEPANGKRRSFSQRVGAGGELAFRNLAHRQGLLATKVEEDFGIDFMCQVDLDHLSRKASDIASTVVGACVRATSSKSGGVFVYPTDAENLLNSGTPLIFILAHLTTERPEEAVIYHRLVDEDFIGELHEFLESGNQRMEVAPPDCRPEDEFRASVAAMVSYGYSERVRVAVAATRVNSVLPNATVEVRTRGNGQLTLVSTVEYYSLFERINEDQERDLLHAVFGSDDHTTDRVAQLSLRPEVIEYLKSMPQPMIFAGLSRELETALRVVSDGRSASDVFTYKAIGTHFGFVHDAGISLIVSEARDYDGKMFHETELFVDPLACNVLDDLGTSLDFFALCAPGARLYREDHDPAIVAGFNVDEMFTPLRQLAAMIGAWRTCSQLDGWPDRSVELKNFAEAEIFNTLAGFAQLINEPGQVAKVAMYFEETADGAKPTGVDRTPTTILLPVIGNLADKTLILHLAVAGSVLSRDGDPAGLEFDSVLPAECRVEVRERTQKATIYPEYVPGADRPTSAVGVGDEGVLPAELQDVRIGWMEVT